MEIDETIATGVKSVYPDIILKQEQLSVLKCVTSGSHVVANLPVGFGKSLIFHCLPDILLQCNKPEKVIVVLPLTAIIKEQKEKIEKLGIPVVALSQNCTNMFEDDCNILEAVGKSRIILAHPEAIIKAELGIKVLDSLKAKIGAVVIDECHKIDDWGKDFRKSFSQLHLLRSFFPLSPVVCLSGTLNKVNIKNITNGLLIDKYAYIAVSPDKPNLKLIVEKKDKGDSTTVMEEIFKDSVDKLFKLKENFPVTLMFMPMEYISRAMAYAYFVFGVKDTNLSNAMFGCLYSNQDDEVVSCIIADLQTACPRFRLIFTTSVIGMGFDPPAVCHIIHCKPPRKLTNYLQEIGRAGRRGQPATATLYFNKADISKNLLGISDDIIEYCNSDSCLRECMLQSFSFTKSEISPQGCLCCNICEKTCKCEDCLLIQVVDDLHV